MQTGFWTRCMDFLMRKKNRNYFILLLVLEVFLFCACASSTDKNNVHLYDESGLPLWAGKTFTNPQGIWAGPVTEKGYYASGQAKYSDEKSSLAAAELDAKVRLADFARSSISSAYRVDKFTASDGRVYVLFFISEKSVKNQHKP